jgi:hypothetical protein
MTAKLAVFTLAVIVALGGLGAGFVRAFDEGEADAVEPVELRKDDTGAELAAEQDDDDPGDDDSTRGDDGTRGGDNTGDGDATFGDDGTAGGENTYVAPANPGHYGGGDSDGGYSTG